MMYEELAAWTWMRRFMIQIGDIFWPFRSCRYRNREVFQQPEERLVDEKMPPVDCRCTWMPIVSRRTVRGTQPPTRRSVKGGRRK